MLEAACIRRPRMINGRYDLGQILETMLFYGQVHLYIDMPIFTSLWNEIGYSGLKDLFSHNRVSASITPEFCAVKNQTYGALTSHVPVFGRMAGREGNLISEKDYAGILGQSLGKMNNRETRKKIQNIINISRKTDYSKIIGDLDNHNKLFFSAASDPESLKVFLRRWLKEHGALEDHIKIEGMKIEHVISGGELIISSNIPISEAIIHPGNISNEDMKWQSIVPSINDYVIELEISNTHSSDIIYADDIEEISKEILQTSLNRSAISKKKISAFTDYNFEGPAIAESYNSGKLPFSKALKIIDKTEKFREWARELPPTADLLSEYTKAINKDAFIDKAPVKAIRFALFTGAGLLVDTVSGGSGLGTAVGTGVSMFDSFVLDGLAKGWRPNSFVQSVKAAIR